ncbi:putative quinol monooxygenase [Klebsiella quasipneumoniae]|uniref:putative quinol monooxygenase n=1 Tax=Klebsiella quasipneumoniae TaxID=1463165 RepID=UPI002D7EBEC0|nr:putative quinol monooxygenase [Klebsiella quasipneumoniae]MEB4699640.1 antibiotic biosynthesis monooxygenase [Klebsiella quasipneumoniae]HBS1665554.1 antibiotic biosynthesis monooxygenase [Klebsiella quasipneumoniae subsp. quasipneumoniae]
MIHIMAIIKAKPGLRSEIIARIAENIPAVKAEEGCIEYRPLTDLSPDTDNGFGPDTVVIVEKWRDELCLKNHATAPHMKRYAENVKEFIRSRDIRILKDI